MYNSIIVDYYFALVPDVPDSRGQYLMLPTTDYAQQTITFNAIDNETITELMRIVCYDQPIYDDDCLEEDEWLGLTLGVDDATVSTLKVTKHPRKQSIRESAKFTISPSSSSSSSSSSS